MMNVSINFPKDISDPETLRLVLANALRLAAAPVSGLVIKVRESDGQVVDWTLAGPDEIEMLVAGLSIKKPDARPNQARPRMKRSFSP
jgi:hypothetical protein